jgi:hypothetical protein
MRVLLDDSPCDVEARYAGEAIAAAAAMADRVGRLVVDVMVDGLAWSPERLEGLGTDRTLAQEVRLVTSSARDLARAALADASEALSSADELQREAAELLEAGRQPAAMQRLGEAITIWTRVQRAVALSVEVMSLEFGAMEVEGVPAAELIQSLGQRLRLLRSALAADDHVGLADTLLYELPEVVQSWRDLLAEMIRGISRDQA